MNTKTPMKGEIVHKSKIGLEILIPLVLVLGTAVAIMAVNGAWLGLVICVPVILFFIHVYTRTFYTITADRRLFVQCGFMKVSIDIDDIEWVKNTNELTNAPALSTDRLEIGYKGGRVLISPADKKKFLADLRTVNPKIQP